MAALAMLGPLAHTRLRTVADAFAIAAVVSLPWSTSATGILTALWALTLIATLDWEEVRGEILTPAGGLPVLLVAFGAIGMAWADVPFGERWHGLESFLKLLAIPLLFAQFRRSERGLWVIAGYALSCVVLLVLSSFIHDPTKIDAVLVKNAATQSGEFVTCIFGFLFVAVECIERRRWWWVAGLVAVMLGMLANMFFVATGRTALVVIPVLLAVFAVRRLSGKGIALLCACVVVIGAIGWLSSPYLRWRTTQVWTDYQKYENSDAGNSSGERIEFYKKSLSFIATAPIIGHGTGSIHALFVQSSIGKTGAAGTAASNPHNQTFAVAIQLGLIGAAVLWAMWIAHGLLFRDGGLAEWVGTVIVVQNVVGSLLNSHLFDFVQGWVYVFGVGVAGGLALKRRALKADQAFAAEKR